MRFRWGLYIATTVSFTDIMGNSSMDNRHILDNSPMDNPNIQDKSPNSIDSCSMNNHSIEKSKGNNSLNHNRDNYCIYIDPIDCSNMRDNTTMRAELRSAQVWLKALHFAFEIVLGRQINMQLQLLPIWL